MVPEGGEWLDQVSPMTGRPSLSVAAGTAADVDRAVGAARAAQDGWRRFAAAERGRLLMALAQALLDQGRAGAANIVENAPTSISLGDFFLDLVPSNVFTAAAENAILPVMVFALFFGIGLVMVLALGEASWSIDLDDLDRWTAQRPLSAGRGANGRFQRGEVPEPSQMPLRSSQSAAEGPHGSEATHARLEALEALCGALRAEIEDLRGQVRELAGTGTASSPAPAPEAKRRLWPFSAKS